MKDDVSLCKKCNCMTHTRLGMCGKCHADKPSKDESFHKTYEKDDGTVGYWRDGASKTALGNNIYEKKKVR